MSHGPDSDHGPDCFGCRIKSVNIGAAATPTRRPTAVFHNEREKRWAKDGAALKTLAKQGITPRSMDGCADIAARATTQDQIESGSLTIGKANT